MFFVVTGNGRNGVVAVTCDSAVAALDKTHQLDTEGVTDLLITDADGLQHAPAHELMYARRCAECRNPGQSVACGRQASS